MPVLACNSVAGAFAGASTATAGALLPGGTTTITGAAPPTSAPPAARDDRLSSCPPAFRGLSGSTTNSPCALVLAVPTGCPFCRNVTSLSGAARPATTAPPCGLTRTISKLGACAAGAGGTLGGATTAKGAAGVGTGAAGWTPAKLHQIATASTASPAISQPAKRRPGRRSLIGSCAIARPYRDRRRTSPTLMRTDGTVPSHAAME